MLDLKYADVCLTMRIEIQPSASFELTYHSFDIVGDTFTVPTGRGASDVFADGVLSLLKDAEGNHCSSFPAALLVVMQTATKLFLPKHLEVDPQPALAGVRQDLLDLLATAKSFDPLTWATELQARSPARDLLHRTDIAAAHRAAVCIYISRVLMSLHPGIHSTCNLEVLAAQIMDHLSSICPTDSLFAATAWPAFIAGAETHDLTRQELVATRFRHLWEVEPWGLIREASTLLKRIWASRSSRSMEVDLNRQPSPLALRAGGDWLEMLRGEGVDWLVM